METSSAASNHRRRRAAVADRRPPLDLVARDYKGDGREIGATSCTYRALAASRDIDSSPLLALAEWQRRGRRTALVTIVHIEGRSPRTIGAQMSVDHDGDVNGYLTCGCLESELARMAVEVVGRGHNHIERYGRGSRFIDMPMPCGSCIDVHFDQSITEDLLEEAESQLRNRRPFALVADLGGGRTRIERVDGRNGGMRSVRDGELCRRVHLPFLRTRLYGQGFAMLQLAHMLTCVGHGFSVYSQDATTCSAGHR